MKTQLLSLTPEEWRNNLPDVPSYQVTNIFRWMHRGVTRADQMTDIPKALRSKVETLGVFTDPVEERRQESTDGTVKSLWVYDDGQAVESVLMRYGYGLSLCLSTQVGCRMGCTFCASCADGLIRDVTAAEMLAVVLKTVESHGRISHIVLMGMGEPLDNFDEVVRFLKLVSHPDGLRISLRNISVSTCGIIPRIEELSRLDLPVTLSVSLHAPDDDTRRKIMPVARTGSVDALLAATKAYFDRTHRRVSYEYILIKGVNDAPEQARLLGRKIKGQPAHINLIPFNPNPFSDFRPSTPATVNAFAQTLKKLGLSVTVRRRLGDGIDAACGQLARKTAKKVSDE